MWWLDFLWGMWHATIALIVFIVHLFGGWDSRVIYDTTRNGMWYDFGYLTSIGFAASARKIRELRK